MSAIFCHKGEYFLDRLLEYIKCFYKFVFIQYSKILYKIRFCFIAPSQGAFSGWLKRQWPDALILNASNNPKIVQQKVDLFMIIKNDFGRYYN